MNKKLLGCCIAALCLGAWSPPESCGDGPLRWEVRLPYQSSPPPEDRYGINPFSNGPAAAPVANEQYANPIPTAYPAGVAPPPEFVTGGAAGQGDPANSLRQGIEAGIQQANQQMSAGANGMLNSARSVGDGFGTQFQEFSSSAQRQLEMTGNNVRNTAEQSFGAAADGLRQVGDSFGFSAPGQPAATAASGLAPPPQSAPATTAPLWSSAQAPPRVSAPASSSAGSSNWSALGNSAGPPLLAPSLAPPPARGTTTATVTGPVIPPSTPTVPTTPGFFHSELVDPQFRNSSSAPSPAAGAGAAGSVFDRSPIFDSPRSGDNRAPAASGGGLGASDPRLSLPAPPGAAQSPFLVEGARPGQQAVPAPVSQPGGPATMAGSTPSGPTGASRPVAPSNDAPPAASPAPSRTADDNSPPWLPLVFVSLALIGSVSANVFLGWSYVDARQKYQTLVRKTAGKFRRAAEAA